MPTYYLYRHIRRDLNVPFYIGIAEKNKKPRFDTLIQNYNRAFCKDKNGHSEDWNLIASIAGYDVEIIFETEDKELIERKEAEFIALYGRVHDNSGSLVNINPGGFVCKTLERVSRLKLAKPIYVYNKDGTFLKKFDIGREAIRELGLKTSLASNIKNNKAKGFSGGYWFFYEYKGELISVPNVIAKRKGNSISVKNHQTKEIIICDSVLKASKLLDIPYGTIQSRLKMGIQYKNYSFKYIKK